MRNDAAQLMKSAGTLMSAAPQDLGPTRKREEALVTESSAWSG